MIEAKNGKRLSPIIGNYKYHFLRPGLTRIVSFDIDAMYLHANLHDGWEIKVPLFWCPVLADATPEERSTFEIDKMRPVTVWFPLINTEITVDQLLSYQDGADEQSHILACASDDNLISDAAVLIHKAARLAKVSITEMLKVLEQDPIIVDAIPNES